MKKLIGLFLPAVAGCGPVSVTDPISGSWLGEAIFAVSFVLLVVSMVGSWWGSRNRSSVNDSRSAPKVSPMTDSLRTQKSPTDGGNRPPVVDSPKVSPRTPENRAPMLNSWSDADFEEMFDSFDDPDWDDEDKADMLLGQMMGEQVWGDGPDWDVPAIASEAVRRGYITQTLADVWVERSTGPIHLFGRIEDS